MKKNNLYRRSLWIKTHYYSYSVDRNTLWHKEHWPCFLKLSRPWSSSCFSTSKIMPEVTHCSCVRLDFKSQVLWLSFLAPSCSKYLTENISKVTPLSLWFHSAEFQGSWKIKSFRVWWVWSYEVTTLYNWSLRRYWFVYLSHLLPNTFGPFSEPLIKKVELHTINSIKNTVKPRAISLKG